MSGPAYVGSFEAVRDFRAALVVFLHEAREALAAHDLEVRRTLEWLLEAEPNRWQQIARQCDDEVVRAKIELERCRCTKLPGGEPASCVEERKAVERARQRRDYADQKVDAVRKWARVVDHEAEEYSGRASQLSALLDVDLVRAVAMLDRTLVSLEAYAAPRPSGGPSTRVSAPPSATTTAGILPDETVSQVTQQSASLPPPPSSAADHVGEVETP